MRTIIFVCKGNGGKSQMAAAVMHKLGGDRFRVISAGTHPGTALNPESVQALETRGYSVAGEYPKPLIGDTARHADRVIVLGGEAVVEIPHVTVERWNTVEPSLDGIVGMPRMKLILDDIEQRVRKLIAYSQCFT
ncbi:low molecular weight phosphatase family protein [Corynebacterium diphtheriae]|uniref:arsenate-mycothiol transferase ArsC n=1 Tax=Corynebacterium diphtheriae TaxID=1717 RepID=UPI0013CBE1D0|nr:low molecular weight phosphatase family protein [Corynebacterium diphtheriae]UJL54859.1 low molecular weight phosphatase family protein [Corynebacterium diphtheriae]CAB0670796.1 low molecular weight phosphatase family protein [Corynebacterium diphtheriae]